MVMGDGHDPPGSILSKVATSSEFQPEDVRGSAPELSWLRVHWSPWRLWRDGMSLMYMVKMIKKNIQYTGRWFGTFCIFPYIGNNHPN